MKVPYKCDPGTYIHHYGSQTGSNNMIPFYQGRLRQSGHGIGSILSSLAKTALPLVKKNAIPFLKKAGREVFRTGAQVLGDVLDQKNFGQSIKHRSKQTLKRKVAEMLDEEEGEEEEVLPPPKPRKKKAKARKKRKTDIFD